MRLVWTEPAVADLDSIHAYIFRDAEVYADAVILEILDSRRTPCAVPRVRQLCPNWRTPRPAL